MSGRLRRWRPASALLLLTLASTGCPNREVPPPHHARSDVVWLTICTLRADHVGAYGGEGAETPSLDALAERGVLFENTLSPAPSTRSSVAATITGLSPRALNLREIFQARNDRALHESFETLAEILQAAGYTTIGVTADPDVGALYGFAQGYDFFWNPTLPTWHATDPTVKTPGDGINARLLMRLHELDDDERFFAHLVYSDVHSPLRVGVATAKLGPIAHERATLIDYYDQQVTYVDAVIGDLLDSLDALGRRDLLVVVTADHGEGFGDSHKTDSNHGSHLFNSTLWVPFVVAHPGLSRAGARVETLVELVDLVPTVLDVLELPVPDGLAGRSLAAWLREGPPPPRPDFAISETSHHQVNRSAILRDDWKLIVDFELSPGSDTPRIVDRFLFPYRREPREQWDYSDQKLTLTNELTDLLRSWQRDSAPRVSDDEARAPLDDATRKRIEAIKSDPGRSGQRRARAS